MSIFSNYLSPMQDIFSIIKGGYACGSTLVKAPVACSRMMGWVFRDPTTIPQARGVRLPKDISMDFVIDDYRFDCLIGGERRWLDWDAIFDIHIACPWDIIQLGLDGDFDKTLPMWTEEEEVVKNISADSLLGGKPSWYHTWEVELRFPSHNTSQYWSIVSNTFIENIKKHIKPGVEVNITGGFIDNTDYRDIEISREFIDNNDYLDYEKHMGFRIEIISINGWKCCWINTMQAALNIFHKSKKTKFFSPSIDFVYDIVKKDQKNININYSE